MNGLVGNTYCPVIAPFRGAGSNGMGHRHGSRVCEKEKQRGEHFSPAAETKEHGRTLSGLSYQGTIF